MGARQLVFAGQHFRTLKQRQRQFVLTQPRIHSAQSERQFRDIHQTLFAFRDHDGFAQRAHSKVIVVQKRMDIAVDRQKRNAVERLATLTAAATRLQRPLRKLQPVKPASGRLTAGRTSAQHQ